MKTVIKILSALATIAGIVYLVATYGDKIVQWAKNLLASCPFCNNECEVVEEDFVTEEAAPVEQAAPAEEAVVEEAVVEESEVEIVVENNEPVAEEADFEA